MSQAYRLVILLSCVVTRFVAEPSFLAGSVSAATPTSEQSTGGTDKRGRQKITWQPPTATQQEEAAQVGLLPEHF